MLQIIGPQQAPEYQAARELCKRMTAAWPVIATSSDHQVAFVAAAKCYGQQVCDVDLILLFHTSNPIALPLAPGEKHPISLASCCLAIEVKDHAPDGVRFVGSQVEVQYHNRWHNVSEQSFRQRFAIRGYLEAQGIKPPFVINLIWLRNVSSAHFPPPPHNLIGQDTTWETVIQQVRQNTRPFLHQASKTWRIQSGGEMTRVVNAFTQVRKPQSTAIEDAKIKSLVNATEKVEQMPAYVKKLGSQLLFFQGRGGTGKTVTLLKMAHVLYTYRQARVLILTYNRVLASDMRRLLALLDVRDGVAQQCIMVQTVHSFFYHLMKGYGVLPNPCDDFLQRYDQYKMTLEMLLSAHPESVNDLVQENNTALSWEYIFIDEAQDWPEDERNILYAIYGYHKFVIADGEDQLTRGHRQCNWLEPVPVGQRQIITLHKGLRLKAGVCTVVNAFAEQVGLTDWQVGPFGKEPGRVLIVQGHYAETRTLNDKLIRDHTAQGRTLIDILFCVPPRLVRHEHDGTNYSLLARSMTEWGVRTWDATNPEITNQYPVDPDQVRIVQYDSCRGLEGWTVVHLGFDELYDYKVNSFEPSDEEANAMFFNREQAAHDYAMRWLMIPLTRGMHTLVIQISPTAAPDHPVVTALRAVAARYPELVEWRIGE